MAKRSSNDWPGPDDKMVVTEMLDNRQSPHWEECYHFLEHLIQVSNLPEDHKQDVTQDAFLSVMKYLPSFHYECRLRTWLGRVAYSRIMDTYRRQTRHNRLFPPPKNPSGDGENENEQLEIHAP